MIPRLNIDWTQVFIALLIIDALIAAVIRLTGWDPLAPHTGRHTRAARLSSPEAVDATQPVPVAVLERNRVGVA